MRLKIFLVFFLLWPPLLLAQFTQTQGTIKDPTGLPYANGTITPTLVCSGSPRFSSSGFPYTPPAQAVGLDGNGSFVMQLADVTQLLPPGCTWSFHVCSAAGTIQPGTPISGGPVCFDVTGLAITGTVQDISAQLSAAAPRLGTGGTGGGATIPNGTPGQFLQYTSASTVAGSPNLFMNGSGGTTVTVNPSFAITNGTTTANLFISTPANALGININGGTNRFLLPVIVNGVQFSLSNAISPNSVFMNFNGTNANPPVCNPAAPVNGRCITFSQSAGSSSGVVVSAALVGDGVATDCFLGNGTFGPCPGTGAGSTPISALTAATSANTISNGDNSQVWNWSLTTAGNTGLNISEDGTASTAAGSSLVKISQPTAGSQAVALTVQSGSSTQSIPAVQIQNSGSVTTANITATGNFSGSVFQSLSTTGIGQLCGGNCTGNSSGQLGGTRVKGSDNAGTGAGTAAGSAILNAGGLTAATPNAAAVNNVTQVASPYFCTGTCTLSTVLCATGSLDSVNACSITPQSQVIGISEGSSNTTTWAVTSGAAQVRVDNTAVIGHTLCTSTANAGAATDSGGTAGCTFGQQIGVVMAVSGTVSIPSGTGQTTATFSPSAPKVALSLASGGTGAVGAGNAGAFAFYPALGNNVVGSANLLDSNGTVNSAEPFTAPNLQLSNPSGILSGVGGTLTPTTGRGGFGFLASGTPAISRFGGTFQQLLTPTVNGVAVTQTTGSQTNFDLNNGTPAAPTNGRNISWQQVANSGTISGALVGDGSTNCLSGQGTYVPCGSGAGGSGTVGNGTGGQFAFYSTTGTSVVGNPHLVDNGALVLTTLPFSTVAAVIPGSGISQIGLPSSGGQIGFLQGAVGTSTFIPFFGFDVGNSAVVTTAAAPFVNLDPATPPAPPNGKNITWAVSGNNVSGSIVGDGTLNCLSGQGTYVSCGGTSGAVSGSGTATRLPVWSSANTLADSAITFTGTSASPTEINFASNSTPLQPTTGAPPGQGIGAFIINRVPTCASSTGAGPAFNRIGVSDLGCSGMWLSYSQTLGAGQNSGLIVSSGNGSNGNLGIGIASLAAPGSALTEERAGYFQTLSAGGLASTNRGVYAVALNIGNSSVAMPLNEAIVAQTGNTLDAGGSAAPTTTDFTVHVLQPRLGSPAVAGQLMTTHAGVKIEPQTLGVEFQTGAHTFGALPACTSTYEGSFAAITDSLTATGTITGGGTFHVLGYCDGTNWTANGGSGGGGTAGVTSINTVPGAFSFTGAGVACSGTTCAFGGGTGSGTVGAGVGRQFAIYNGTGTAVVGTPNLLDSPTGVAELTAEIPILPTAGIVLSTNTIGNLPTTPMIVSGGNSTPPAALSAGISGFAFGAAAAPGGSNIPLVNQNAGGWFPVTTTSVNAAQLTTTNADFNSTTPAAPANGINVTWQKTTPAAGGTSTSLSAAVVGDGLATDCLVGTGVFVPCPGGGVTPPPRTVVGTCPQTGVATGGNCTVLFTPAFVNPPVCTVTAIDQTPGTPTHVITWQIGGPNSANTSAFSIVFATTPAGIGVIFNYICMGNPN